MAWCCQATSHYLSQCWPRSMVSLCHNELKRPIVATKPHVTCCTVLIQFVMLKTTMETEFLSGNITENFQSLPVGTMCWHLWLRVQSKTTTAPVINCESSVYCYNILSTAYTTRSRLGMVGRASLKQPLRQTQRPSKYFSLVRLLFIIRSVWKATSTLVV